MNSIMNRKFYDERSFQRHDTQSEFHFVYGAEFQVQKAIKSWVASRLIARISFYLSIVSSVLVPTMLFITGISSISLYTPVVIVSIFLFLSVFSFYGFKNISRSNILKIQYILKKTTRRGISREYLKRIYKCLDIPLWVMDHGISRVITHNGVVASYTLNLDVNNPLVVKDRKEILVVHYRLNQEATEAISNFLEETLMKLGHNIAKAEHSALTFEFNEKSSNVRHHHQPSGLIEHGKQQLKLLKDKLTSFDKSERLKDLAFFSLGTTFYGDTQTVGYGFIAIDSNLIDEIETVATYLKR